MFFHETPRNDHLSAPSVSFVVCGVDGELALFRCNGNCLWFTMAHRGANVLAGTVFPAAGVARTGDMNGVLGSEVTAYSVRGGAS